MRIYSQEEIPQGSEEWYAVRLGKFTSSDATAIGNNGAGLKTLALKKTSERLSSGPRKTFSTLHTERGKELEPIARELYELETGVKVEQVGFIERDEYSGSSPDGLIGEDGLNEIKSVDDDKYLKILAEQKPDSDHVWQANHQMLITERKWDDLVYYNPNFKKSLFVFRIYPDPEKQEKLRKGIEEGTRLIKEYLALYEERLDNVDPVVIGGPQEEKTVLVYEGSKKVGAITVPKTFAPKGKGGRMK